MGERTKERYRKKDGRKEGRKKRTNKQRKNERKNVHRRQCCPATATTVPHVNAVVAIPDASQMLSLAKSSRFDAKCENPSEPDPEVKCTK